MPYSFEEILERKRECSINYFGNEINFSYRVEVVTAEFRASLMRFMRHGQRMQQRHKELSVTIASTVKTLDAEAAQEDAEAELAIERLDSDELQLKSELDDMLLHAISDWDMLDHGSPAPVTLNNIARLTGEIEALMIAEILKGSQPLGEANGQQPMKLLPSSSKPAASVSMRKASSSSHRHN